MSSSAAAGAAADAATATAPKISPPRKRWVLPPDGVVVAASDSPPRTNPLLQRRSSLDSVPPLLLAHLWRHRAAWALYADDATAAWPPLLHASLAGMAVFVLLNWFWFSLMVKIIAKKTSKTDEKRA